MVCETVGSVTVELACFEYTAYRLETLQAYDVSYERALPRIPGRPSAERLLARDRVANLPLVGADFGFPGPVQVSVGRPFSPPGMMAWDGYPVAERMSARSAVDVWVENEANMVAPASSAAAPRSRSMT